MKRLIAATAALALVAGMVSADVESANTVGYTTVDMKQGFNMMAVNFDEVLDAGPGLSLQEVFPTVTNGVLVEGLSAGSGATADNIQFYDPVTDYTTYYIFYTSKGTATTKNYKWVDTVAGNVADDTPIPNGTAFWFRKRKAGTLPVVVAGQVANDVSESKQVKTGFNFFASIYPVDWNPNDLGSTYWQTNGAAAGSGTTGDNIQIYDPVSDYSTYYLFYTSKGTATTKNYKWVDTVAGNIVATDILVPGKGAWYRHRSTGFQFNNDKPY